MRTLSAVPTPRRVERFSGCGAELTGVVVGTAVGVGVGLGVEVRTPTITEASVFAAVKACPSKRLEGRKRCHLLPTYPSSRMRALRRSLP